MRPSSSAAVPAMNGAPLRNSPPHGFTATSRSSTKPSTTSAARSSPWRTTTAGGRSKRWPPLSPSSGPSATRAIGLLAVLHRQGAEHLHPVVGLHARHRLDVGRGHAVDVVAQAHQQHPHQRQRLRQAQRDGGAAAEPAAAPRTEPPSASTLRFTTSMPTPRPDSSLTSSRVEKPGTEDELDRLALGERRGLRRGDEPAAATAAACEPLGVDAAAVVLDLAGAACRRRRARGCDSRPDARLAQRLRGRRAPRGRGPPRCAAGAPARRARRRASSGRRPRPRSRSCSSTSLPCAGRSRAPRAGRPRTRVDSGTSRASATSSASCARLPCSVFTPSPWLAHEAERVVAEQVQVALQLLHGALAPSSSPCGTASADLQEAVAHPGEALETAPSARRSAGVRAGALDQEVAGEQRPSRRASRR